MKRILLMSVVLVALLLSACAAPSTTPTAKADPEREAIITFTRQALAIEAGRAELMEYFASVKSGGGPWFASLMSKTFLEGVIAGRWKPDPGRDLEGMTSLRNKLFLLDCPQGLQAIKDSLSYIYASEIEQFRLWQALSSLSASYDFFPSPSRPEKSDLPRINISVDINPIYPEVTKDNLDYWKQKADAEGSSYLRKKIEGQWGELQSLRRDTYIHWAQILQEHGIDLSKEGFTALSPTPTPKDGPGWYIDERGFVRPGERPTPTPTPIPTPPPTP